MDISGNPITDEDFWPDCDVLNVNPYPAYHDYCRFQFVLLVEQITVIGNEMCV